MPLRTAAGLLLAASTLALPQTFRFEEHRIRGRGGESFSGCAAGRGTLVAWGAHVLSWSIPSGRMRLVAGRAAGPYAEGGCLLDIAGRQAIVLNEGAAGRALVWFHAAGGKRHVIDTGVETADILPVTLFDRRGVVLVQRGAQVRFYEIPPDPTRPWPVHELYSFYTPSDQGGLGIADIDGDGLPDLIAGNDWIRSPASFGLPWHLFPIELWNEEARSALLRQALAPLVEPGKLNLAAVQRRMAQARLAWFEKPADPRQLWREHRIEIAPPLNRPNSLAVADFDGDGRPDLLVAESAGPGRLLILHNAGDGRFEEQKIAGGRSIDHALVVEWNGDGRPDIVTLRRDGISWWENRRE